MRAANPPRGFTLIELMVVLAILLVLALIAMPSFSDFFERNRVRGAATEVIAVIDNARAEAVKNDLDVNIAMIGSGTAWCVGANAATIPTPGNPPDVAVACNCTDTAQCQVSGMRLAMDVGAFPDVAVGDVPDPLVFDSTLGAIVPLGGRVVTLTSPKGKYDVTIEVNGLGQARMCTPTGKPEMSGIKPCA